MSKKNPYKTHFINFKKILFDLSKWAGWPLFFWFRVKKIFINHKQKKHEKGGAIVISNHILYSDPMVLHCAFWYRRLHFIITDDITPTKFKRWLYGQWGCIPIDRNKFSIKDLRGVIQRLEGGYMIGIFPEGHVSLKNENPMSPFKSGAVLMAYQANVPIIPVYREIRPNVFARQRVVVGEPIDIRKQFGENIGMAQIEEISKYLFDKEQELREFYRQNVKGK